MGTINRSAALVRPKQPYVDWAARVDDEAPPTAQELQSEISVYLLPEYDSEEEIEGLLRAYAETIFAQELEAWHRDREAWPSDMGYDALMEWFEVRVESVVTDLGSDPLEMDAM